MKIKKEYNIEVVSKGDLFLCRSSVNNSKLNISEVMLKPSSKHIVVPYQLKSNVSAIKDKNIGSNMKVQYSADGFIPKASLFMPVIDNDILYLHRIDTGFILRSDVDHLNKEVETDSSLSFRKVMSREEIEHRNKNINYKIRLREEEECLKLQYTDAIKTRGNLGDNLHNRQFINREEPKGSYSTGLDIDNLLSTLIIQPKCEDKIRKCILYAKIVNYADLKRIFSEDIEAVKRCVSKMTFYFKGRYILSHSFYDQDLQNKREKILDLLRKKDYITLIEMDRFIDENYFLIHEICNEKDCRFVLKGYYEEKDPSLYDYEMHSKALVIDTVKNRNLTTLALLKKETNLGFDEISKLLDESNVIFLTEDVFTVYTDDKLRNRVIDILIKKKSFKSTEYSKMVMEESKRFGIDIDVFSRMFEEFCYKKKSTWYLKDTSQIL